MPNFQRFRAAILILLSGLILTAAMIGLWYGQMTSSSSQRTNELQQAIALQLAADLDQKEAILRQIQAAFIAQPSLSRGQFNQLALNTNFPNRAPAIFAIGFIRPVASALLNEYVLTNRSNTDFGAGFYAQFGVQTDSAQAQVLEMVSPLNRSSALWLGEDLAKVPLIQANLDSALSTGLAWGASINLRGQPNGNVYALYLPIFQNVLEQPTAELLQDNYLGSAVVWFKVSELLRGIERDAQSAGFAIRLMDLGPNQRVGDAESTILFTSKKWSAAISQYGAAESQIVNIFGRQWRLEFANLHGALLPSEQRLILFLALLGCTLSCVLAVAFQRFFQRQRVLELAAQGQESIQSLTFERQSRAMLDAVSDPLILRDINGVVIYANALAEHRFAEGEQGLLSENQFVFDAAELGNLAMPVQLSQQHLDRDGVLRQYDVIIKPLRNQGLHWVGNVLHARDISAGAALTQELQYKLDRLSELVEVSSDWFWEQDAQARFTYVSGGFFADLDVNPAIFIGKCRWELGSGGLSEAQWDAHRGVLASHWPYRDFEYQAFLNNQILYFSVSGRPIFAADGSFAGYRGVGRNVTAMRNAQVALFEERQRALATLESIADGVLTTDVNGRIDYINPVASALLGWELEMARGQFLGAVYQSVDVKNRLPLANLVTASLQGGADNQGARRSVLLNKLGLHFQIEESAARIRDENNRTLGAVLVFRDVSNWRDENERVDGF
nr:PAS domain S-box protein [uncultured Deefgea sp.]